MVHEEPAEFFIDKTIGHHIMDRKRLRIFLNITEKESASAGGLKLVLKPCLKDEAFCWDLKIFPSELKVEYLNLVTMCWEDLLYQM